MVRLDLTLSLNVPYSLTTLSRGRGCLLVQVHFPLEAGQLCSPGLCPVGPVPVGSLFPLAVLLFDIYVW